MANYNIVNCTIKVNGARGRRDALDRIQEMLNSYDEMNCSEASIIICNNDWNKNLQKEKLAR